jgi:hypothetical protein
MYDTDNVTWFSPAEGICLNDLHWERRPYSAFDAYSESKLANVLFSVELARRLKGNKDGPAIFIRIYFLPQRKCSTGMSLLQAKIC